MRGSGYKPFKRWENHWKDYVSEAGRPEQRFIISWASAWRTKAREDALKNLIKTDPHSPGMNRAVQPLLNIDAFYEAFNIKESDKMYLDPNERVKIY